MPDDKPPAPATNGAPPASNPIPPGAVSAEPMNVPPTPLETPPAKVPPAPTIPGKKEEPKDSFRELIETIVFVVVLVLMLKTFLAEAFVIPTGSMATTLLGYHREVTCQQCGHKFLVNASKEADPTETQRQIVISCTCPNCAFENPVAQPIQHPAGAIR